jgi:very-short-patch-repair endonuclease
MGYDIITGVRFTEHGGRASCKTAVAMFDGEKAVRLAYGQAATIWRLNLGWKRRTDRNRLGFVLDVERGYWKGDKARNEDPEERGKGRTRRVIPFVEDRRNCLLFEPIDELSQSQMSSLQAALKSAIQVLYQLEDNELAAEPMPHTGKRRLILLYESAEGGAGVLRRLLDPDAAARVAKEALKVCHFDPDSGEDLKHAPNSTEECEAACYNCLMNYGNQTDHALLDRKSIRDYLVRLARSTVSESQSERPRAEHLRSLRALCASGLEREWLDFLEANQYRLPSTAQKLIEACQTRPDFEYDEHSVAIYVDGPIHDFPDRQERDRTKADCLEDLGYRVIRFGKKEEWADKIAKYPNVFGRRE